MSILTRTAFLSLILLPVLAAAQSTEQDVQLLESGLDQLLEKNPQDPTNQPSQLTKLTDLVEEDVRLAPGIIQVLTAKEIAAAGCRTLEDALMLIPSFILARDVDDVLGVGVRGQWAHEGKCLFMLNGMPLNEASYGIYALGSRMSMDNVSRIEVINGPGSVLYGGFAALAVVNIVTKSLLDEESLQVASTTSLTHDGPNLQATEISGQHRVSAETELDLQAGIITGRRFAASATYPGGLPISYADSSRTEDLSGYFRIMHKGFVGQFLINDHTIRVSDQNYDVLMRSLIANGTKRFDLGHNAYVDLTGLYRNQLPWSYTGLVDPAFYASNTMDKRYSLNATFVFSHSKWLQTSWGTHGYLDHFEHMSPSPEAVFAYNSRSTLDVLDLAAFGQARLRSKWGTLLAGVRAEQHTLGGFLSTPRFAYTALFGKAHVKALYSRAFKMPTMQNANVGPIDGSIRAEEVVTREVELGYRAFGTMDISLCAFHTSIENPIVYVLQYDGGLPDSYVNRSSIGSEGLELRMQWSGKKAGITANFSAYRTDPSLAGLPEVMLPTEVSAGHLGLPQLKGTFIGRVEVARSIKLSGNAAWLSDSWYYQGLVDEQQEPVLEHAPAALRLGARLEHAPAILKGFTWAAAVDDVLDQGWSIHSPYNNELASLPMAGRTWTVRLTYRFPL